MQKNISKYFILLLMMTLLYAFTAGAESVSVRIKVDKPAQQQAPEVTRPAPAAAGATTRVRMKRRTDAAAKAGVKDTTPPSITISTPTVPSSNKVATSNSRATISGKVDDASGVSEVDINGTAASIDDNGMFNADLMLKIGENKVTVTAVDVYNNKTTKVFTIKRSSETTTVAAVPKNEPAKHSEPPQITILTPEITRSLKVVEKNSNVLVTGIAQDSAGVAEVRINGNEAALDEQGKFSANVLLKVGQNKVVVTAMDIHGNRSETAFEVNRAAGTAKQVAGNAPVSQDSGQQTAADDPPPRSTGKNYALVIGINNYRNEIPKLKTAVNDAKVIAKLLEENYGFKTTLILDEKASRANIINELNRLKDVVNPDDRMLIYYAGHGFKDNETDTSYWYPIDADKSVDTNWIDAKNITNQLKRAKARQVLVIADSCYSGTMTRAFDPSLSGKGTQRDQYLKKMKEKMSRVLIASGGNEPVSDGGGKGHSIFADVLIKALRSPEFKVFTAQELLTNQIKEPVAGRSSQTPEYSAIKASGHDGGDFVFEKVR